jgi:hypothetical protein
MRVAARLFALVLALPAAAQERLPIFDAHIHFSHDAAEQMTPAEAVAILRKAGLKRAMVSSADDEGTQKLYRAAPELIVPEIRPYRRRSDVSTWVKDETIVNYVEERLAKHKYAAIGEFHVYGADADLPVMRRMVELARQYGLLLHAHSDADAIDRLFEQDPQARILWAHAGFERPSKVREMLAKHRRLWADLAYRSEHGAGDKVDPDWLALFKEFPDRFMVGTDTFTPERWHYIGEHAEWTRRWLATVPKDLAEKIAWRNAEAMLTALKTPWK